jgi:hypothetical protein
MVEVFKTNISEEHQIAWIIRRLKTIFPGYRINFDLGDCDKILRVETQTGKVDSGTLINLMNRWNFQAEILSDNIDSPAFTGFYPQRFAGLADRER